MPRFAPNKMPTDKKRRYFELILQRQLISPVVAHRGADSGSRGPVAGVRVAMSTKA